MPIRRDDKLNDNQFFQLHADCEGPCPGGTTIVDIAATSSPASDFPDLLPTLKGQYSGPTIPGTGPPPTPRPPANRWTFTNGGVLHGTFVIEQYIAGDTEDHSDCIHSAHLSCRYEPGQGDPAGLDFIQMARVSLPRHALPPSTLFIDPYPDKAPDDSPFYFNPNDNRDRYRQAPHAPGILFGDSPGFPFPQATPHSIKQEFWLVLGAPDPAGSHTMKLYEGFQWGFSGSCAAAPEPSSWAALGVMALGVLWRRRRH